MTGNEKEKQKNMKKLKKSAVVVEDKEYLETIFELTKELWKIIILQSRPKEGKIGIVPFDLLWEKKTDLTDLYGGSELTKTFFIDELVDNMKEEFNEDDEEIKTLIEKDNLTAAEVERAKILYDITLKQMALEEAKANKSIMRLVRDASGNWSYQYMADIDKVQQAQDDLTSSMDELLEHDKQAFQETQDEILERRKQFLSFSFSARIYICQNYY